jgi:hypothetical protein
MEMKDAGKKNNGIKKTVSKSSPKEIFSKIDVLRPLVFIICS